MSTTTIHINTSKCLTHGCFLIVLDFLWCTPPTFVCLGMLYNRSFSTQSYICRLADCRLGQNPNYCLSFLLILKNGRERKCLVVKRSKYSKATHKILLLGQLHGKVLTHVFLEGATIIGRQDAPLRNEGALRLAKFDPCGAERRSALHALCRPDEERRHLFKTTHTVLVELLIPLAALYIWIIGKIMKLQPHSSTAFELNHLLR